MADRRYRIDEIPVPGKRLGRSVRHDPRSLAYPVLADNATPETARWERRVPVLEQGDLGSCTGNATVGVLGTDPFYDTLSITRDEDLAVQVYSFATQLDPFDGQYPPVDTGSDGLSVAKAAQRLGYISGYRHILSIDAAFTAIKAGPFITGTYWLADMDEPDAEGIVRASGAVRGGHEYEVVGYDRGRDLWEFVNSWGDGWGQAGHFFMSTADYVKLLAADGDATVLVPISQPAPTPVPVPAPTPEPTPVPPIPDFPPLPANRFPMEAVTPWLKSRICTPKGRNARNAIRDWIAKGGH
jgi:hypothetical protein